MYELLKDKLNCKIYFHYSENNTSDHYEIKLNNKKWMQNFKSPKISVNYKNLGYPLYE